MAECWHYFIFLYYVKYGYSIRDFFSCELCHMTNSEILNFISTREILLFYKKFNDLFTENLINNKEKTLDLFRSYIYRDWVCGTDDKRLEEFLSKYDKCIVKPVEGSGGYGIEIVDTDLIKNGNYSVEGKLIEALIIQHDEINKLYPCAVNTLRVFSYYGHIIGSVLRVGRGGMNIDNASSGGLFAEVDIDNGIIRHNAVNYQNKEYVVHPDTQVQFLGFQIPMWDDVCNLICDATKLVEGIPLLGWDIALTSIGPEIIEVNAQPEIALLQISSKKGIRQILRKYDLYW